MLFRSLMMKFQRQRRTKFFSGARAFVKENKGRYECGGYIYSGEGQELGQFWAKLNIGNAKLKKATSNTSITDGNGNYSIAGATSVSYTHLTRIKLFCHRIDNLRVFDGHDDGIPKIVVSLNVGRRCV